MLLCNVFTWCVFLISFHTVYVPMYANLKNYIKNLFSNFFLVYIIANTRIICYLKNIYPAFTLWIAERCPSPAVTLSALAVVGNRWMETEMIIYGYTKHTYTQKALKIRRKWIFSNV